MTSNEHRFKHRSYLGVMSIAPEVTFSNLLSMIHFAFVDPSFARIPQISSSAHPKKVLALLRPLFVRAVVETCIR